MMVLDTDHISELQREESKRGARLSARISALRDRQITTTIITLEEQFRGQLAVIHRKKTGTDQVISYARFSEIFNYFTKWIVLPFDQNSAHQFDLLSKQKVRIGSKDLKIASIVLVQGATLLSANLRHVKQVPGLLVEDWLCD